MRSQKHTVSFLRSMFFLCVVTFLRAILLGTISFPHCLFYAPFLFRGVPFPHPFIISSLDYEVCKHFCLEIRYLSESRMAYRDGVDNIVIYWDDDDGIYNSGQFLTGKIVVSKI